MSSNQGFVQERQIPEPLQRDCFSLYQPDSLKKVLVVGAILCRMHYELLQAMLL
ncbi:hypothetical protein DPPLL_35060 [Desulfofustis limnaeus]|uniref:Uncharacterized protein n=1 Tax=Desulfofustis limnaeus TaxID=2740163 RepID=A0ABM7WDT8_9BACT|nr:hypothetical protein DPPLL_35060 [Desulfofustis limnaeus]